MWADPILSSVFVVAFFVMSVVFSLMLLVLRPPQFVFLCGISLFTPPDIQNFVIEYVNMVYLGLFPQLYCYGCIRNP